MKIDIYACPTPGCGNYYGASSMGDLSTSARGAAIDRDTGKEREAGTRDLCPDCLRQGRSVRRVLRTTHITLDPTPAP